MDKSLKVIIADALFDADIKCAVIMPDSLSSQVFSETLLHTKKIELVQVQNENDAIAISSGRNLTGDLTVCIMENSGIRYGCEMITRFETIQGIHNIYILSWRGTFGERNWWGIFHDINTKSIIKNLRFKTISVKSKLDFKPALTQAVATFLSEQVSVALILERQFFE